LKNSAIPHRIVAHSDDQGRPPNERFATKPSAAARCTSVKEVVAAIGAFIDHWNDHPFRFSWAKDSDDPRLHQTPED
jgi:hypothetical protein